MSTNNPTHTASCLCESVKMDIYQDLEKAIACHCTMCRKITGSFFISTDVKDENLKIYGIEDIQIHESSEKVQRAFCKKCGSCLWWKAKSKNQTSITLGIINGKTNTEIGLHIFTNNKGDYYKICDGVEQNPS